MKLEIKDIINKHKNSPAVVIGHGPSYSNYRNRIQEFKNRGFIIFDCNEWYFFQNVEPHYWVTANSEYIVQKYHSKINSYKSTFLYADSVDLTDRDFVKKILLNNYLPYDQRHFNSQKCGCGKCCRNIIPGRLTIQEELKNYTGYNTRYGSGDTVAIHMIVFSILMGCNPVYITGIDLKYEYGYAETINGIAPSNIPDVSNNHYNDRIIGDFKILRDSVKNINVNIINTNMNAFFDTFEKGSI